MDGVNNNINNNKNNNKDNKLSYSMIRSHSHNNNNNNNNNNHKHNGYYPKMSHSTTMNVNNKRNYANILKGKQKLNMHKMNGYEYNHHFPSMPIIPSPLIMNNMNNMNNNDDDWDYYYMDLMFRGFIRVWDNNSKQNGGYIHISGEDKTELIPFNIGEIINYEYINKYYRENYNHIPIKCQIGNSNGNKYGKNITIELPQQKYNNGNNQNDLYYGSIKMLATPTFDGIIFCEQLNEAIRFKYNSNKLFIFDQEIY
eukprot:24183_1